MTHALAQPQIVYNFDLEADLKEQAKIRAEMLRSQAEFVLFSFRLLRSASNRSPPDPELRCATPLLSSFTRLAQKQAGAESGADGRAAWT